MSRNVWLQARDKDSGATEPVMAALHSCVRDLFRRVQDERSNAVAMKSEWQMTNAQLTERIDSCKCAVLAQQLAGMHVSMPPME